MTQAIQYQIKDPQGGVYGPATLATIEGWIREGRISAAMQLAPENTQNWQPITSFPELSGALGVAASAPAASPYAAPAQYPAAYPQYAAAPPTNGMAMAALICPLVGIAFCMPIGAILGIVFGMIGKRQIQESNGAQTGEGLARAGLIIGIIELALTALIIVAYIAIIAVAVASSHH